MAIAEGRTDLKIDIALAHLLIPGCIDIGIWFRVEEFIVIVALQDAFLGVVNETHISWSIQRALNICCRSLRS